MDGDTKNILKINCWKYRNHMMTLTYCGIQKGNLFEQEASSYKHNHTHTQKQTDETLIRVTVGSTLHHCQVLYSQ